MTDGLRERAITCISRERTAWEHVIASTYVLLHRDRISSHRALPSDETSGIWGKSYVRTYYAWIGSPPSSSARVEGGIATTYYVLRHLVGALKRCGLPLEPSIVRAVTRFFRSRIKSDGSIGVATVTDRKHPTVAAHLRHTCFGYLTVRELEKTASIDADLRQKVQLTVGFLLQPRTESQLLDEWLDESWPVGGIAAYILARDDLHETYRTAWNQSAWRVWPGVREKLLCALAQVTSWDIESLRSPGQRAVCEHYPFWHPIMGLPMLRLHSTLGCLSMLDGYTSFEDDCRDRIGGIIGRLREETLGDDARAPRFARGGPPSFAAASGILRLLLHPQYESSPGDAELLSVVMDFIVQHWDDPDVYVDYWTEFTAPLLDLDEIHAVLDVRAIIERAADWVGKDGNVGTELGRSTERTMIDRLATTALR